MFSRAVRRPAAWRRATASGRRPSRVRSCRSSTSPRSARTDARSISVSTTASTVACAPEVGVMVSNTSPSATVAPTADGHLVDHATELGRDDVLHLHRLEDRDRLSGSHQITGLHVDRDDRPCERRRDGVHGAFLARYDSVVVPSLSPRREDDMRIGLMIGSDRERPRADRLAGLVSDVQEADRAGFTSVWIPQIPGYLDALTAIAVLGPVTENIELGTAVVPVQTRHPIPMAQQALTTQAACGGRFALGLGPSHHWIIQDQLGLPYERPAALMRDYLEVVNRAFAGPGPDRRRERLVPRAQPDGRRRPRRRCRSSSRRSRRSCSASPASTRPGPSSGWPTNGPSPSTSFPASPRPPPRRDDRRRASSRVCR